MKKVSKLYPSYVLSIFILLLSSLPGYSMMAHKATKSTEKVSRVHSATDTKVKAKKIGFFKRVRMLRSIKKAMKKQLAEGEKASPLARVALILFISSFVVSLIPVSFIPVLGSLAFLASIIMAFIVLFSEDNRKSKAIAKTILIVAGILVILAFVAILALAAAWGW